MYNADLDIYMSQMEDLLGGGIFSLLLSETPSYLMSLATYVLTALALQTIAKRRGIHHPWLAWIPVANAWLLGCIADQFRYVSKGEVKSRRKVLLGLQIAQAVLSIALIVLCLVMVVQLFAAGLDYTETLTESAAQAVLAVLVGPVVAMLLMALPMLVVSIVYLVFYYICLHDIYKSCEPGNATLYLVLSILIQVTQPVFLFICRNKDQGMPQRNPQPEQFVYQPPYDGQIPPAPPTGPEF